MPGLEKPAVVTCWYRTWLGCMRIYFFKGVVGGGGDVLGREGGEKVRWFAISISLEFILLLISVCWGLLGWFSMVVHSGENEGCFRRS